MAYQLAVQAQAAFQQELGPEEQSLTFILPDNWDSLKKGLLAGELLHQQLRQMETAYLAANKREYEITKHVSLALLNPEALLRLTTEGECILSIPEAVFDLECPGHYMRRIKSVSITIPCVTGPYTSVNCVLTLTGDKVRKETGITGGYAYTGPEDARFQHNYIGQSIATSSGQNDSGIFELNFRDERYLPFEGRGVISDWNLKLTSAVPTFDWSTITDVVMHLHYTAREGGELLRTPAIGALTDGLNGVPLRRGFSAKHEFPTEWSAFLRPPQSAAESTLKLDLSESAFPILLGMSG
jgi:Tc toxin complex TcA C-terminal TcB-binding domain